jgi:hypothetical protein
VWKAGSRSLEAEDASVASGDSVAGGSAAPGGIEALLLPDDVRVVLQRHRRRAQIHLAR